MLDYQSEGGGGGGDRTPIIKFSAQSGDFIAVNRVQVEGKWMSEEQELTLPLRVAMDMADMEVGYMAFMPTPDFRMAKVGEPMPQKPDEVDDQGKPLHRWGFRVRLGNSETGLREISSASKNVYERMKALFAEYEAGKAANPGKVPVVDIVGTERVQQQLNNGQTQTWRVPQWSVTAWVDRPALFDGAPAAPTPPPVDAPPPAPAAPPAANVQDDDIFKL